ncbi:isoprenylcysteine carboxylmethyltransferase family protein [Desulfopila sp. IMCC35008]|uniref:methyltransferase family protein n=1 Tax=Desulfopila sp. IMCC35008 TaxID=2653858 RepID=UPI0013D526CB|nr:hypothetical protein [Desulfopila sp. IMCC35008]
MVADPLLPGAVFYTASWCFLHSLLLSDGFARLVRPLVGDRWRWHRIVYNLVAAATLLPLLVYLHLISEPPLFKWQGWLSCIRYFLLLTGILLFISGSRVYDFQRFTGLSQLRSGEHSVLLSGEGDTPFQQYGILGVTRHPWYGGGILLIWSMRAEYGVSVCIIYTLFTVYLIIGAFLEEKRLAAVFREEYSRYRGEVSMFFPFKWLMKCLSGKR